MAGPWAHQARLTVACTREMPGYGHAAPWAMLWLVLQLFSEYAFENRESKLARTLRRRVQSLRKMASWKVTGDAKTEVNTEKVAVELTVSVPNPVYGVEQNMAD